MSRKLMTGELAFLPSESTLIQFLEGKNPSSVRRFVKIEEPTHVLIVGLEHPYYKVLYNGECWLSREQDIYPTEVHK